MPASVDSVAAAVPWARRRDPRSWGTLAVAGALLGVLSGCLGPEPPRSPRYREVEAAARPLLEMNPDANWTACYNRLLELGGASVDYLVSQPIMRCPAAPDDLRVMLHTSLLRLLADPGRLPAASVACFETTLDVLHFDPKVRGRRLGKIVLRTTRIPKAWHELYPADFDHSLAAEIDVEADRQAVLRWWQSRGGRLVSSTARRPLRPRPEHLWSVLPRRYADVWTYELKQETYLCALPPMGSALFRARTQDYNLVRAICIWLASTEAPAVQDRLIELVAHPSPIVAYNARFALRHSPDPRIREVIEQYNQATLPAVSAAVHNSLANGWLELEGARRAISPGSSCEEQGSAAHEVDQVHNRLCHRDRCGDRNRRAVWQP